MQILLPIRCSASCALRAAGSTWKYSAGLRSRLTHSTLGLLPAFLSMRESRRLLFELFRAVLWRLLPNATP